MGERIKTLRKSLGLTQQEFADILGIKRGAIANYEIERNAPIDAVLNLICRSFNVNFNWLKYGEGDMFVPVEDERAAYISELLIDVENPFYSLIESILKTYIELDEKDKTVLKNFAKKFLKNKKDE